MGQHITLPLVLASPSTMLIYLLTYSLSIWMDGNICGILLSFCGNTTILHTMLSKYRKVQDPWSMMHGSWESAPRDVSELCLFIQSLHYILALFHSPVIS